MPNLSGPTLIVILFIVLLLFGAPKLPALAKSLGQSMKILKKEVSSDDITPAKGDATAAAVEGSSEATTVALTEAEQAQAELAQARAEAAAAKAEAEALRQQAAATETPRAD
ncbi:Sec-independent protein translocase subunit TatA/TatB [Leucobacter chinensis]|uniref:Sec-independent protein translocase subunit TatA/TatB n=1 Tax=Leucobacter chinensis TaxID=2851010 RepID=UPI0020B75A8E|nr:twin-arginine translocase TatA/TatE family subunit [Leucobacter chinensis]